MTILNSQFPASILVSFFSIIYKHPEVSPHRMSSMILTERVTESPVEVNHAH